MNPTLTNEQAAIYKITSPSGRVYIGQSRHVRARRRYYASGKCKAQPKIHRSLLKYGWASHVFKVIHELPHDVDKSVLDLYEQLYMDAYRDAGAKLLNLREGGSAGTHSEESNQKNRLSHRTTSEEVIAKIRAANLGKKHTQDSKDRIGRSSSERPRTPEWRTNIAKAHRGKKRGKLSPESIAKRTATRRKNGGFVFSEEHKKNISISMKGAKKRKQNDQSITNTRAGD